MFTTKLQPIEKSLLFNEVELMETFKMLKVDGSLLGESLLFNEVELMETS